MRNFCSVLMIVFLLPFVVGVFINGDQILTSNRPSGRDLIWVETDSGSVQMEYSKYLDGVCALEIQEISEYEKLKQHPEKLETEFLKTQAIIARTNVWYNAVYSTKKGWIYSEDFLDPVKAGNIYSKDEYQRIVDGVEQTSDQILCVDKKPVQAWNFLESNGMTRNGKEVFKGDQYGYLLMVECPNDSKNIQIEEVKLTYKMLAYKCRLEKPSLQKKLKWKDIKVISTDRAGYVSKIQLGNVTMSGEQFRQILDLPSASFKLQDYYGKLRILTKGNGHGIGLSQMEANAMAKNGKNYEEILKYFYQNITIESTQDIFSNME